VRVSTAFNRMLALPGATVRGVRFEPAGMVVEIRARGRRLRCSCGWSTRAGYDRSRRRWRHLDAGSCRVWLEAEIRRLDCRRCGRVVTEEVPWARLGAWHTRDFEDTVAWLAQRTDKTTIATLLRCSWKAVDNIIARVVADYLDTARLEGLYRIGVDEISYKRGHYYLTVVADHDSGRVVWVAPGRRGRALADFYDALGSEGRDRIEAVSMDLSAIYTPVTQDALPHATICYDPFHVIQIANRALDLVLSASRHGAEGTITGRQWRAARVALRSGGERLDPRQQELVNSFRRTRRRVFRAWELKEDLRYLYRVDYDLIRPYLKTWITAALRSRLPAFTNLAKTIRTHYDGICAAAELGLSNSRLEGINAKIRLIQRRGYGYHSIKALAASIYLCLGGITVRLPTHP
jgi:transposase